MNSIIEMHCVCQIDSQSGSRQVIEIISSENKFIKTVKNKLNEIYDFKYLIGSGINELNSKQYPIGHYLMELKSNNKFVDLCFVEKSKHTSLGYIYNSTYERITQIYYYECVPFVSNQTIQMIEEDTVEEPVEEESIEEPIEEESIEQSTVEESVEKSLNKSENNNGSLFELFQCSLTFLRNYPSTVYICSSYTTERNRLVKSILDTSLKSSMLIISNKSADFYKQNYPDAEVLSVYDYNAVNDYYFYRDNHAFIVLDGCFPDTSDKLLNLIKSSEEFNITFVVSSPYIPIMGEICKEYFDYLFFSANGYMSELHKKLMYNTCDDIFPTQEIFTQFFEDARIKNYMVISKHSLDNNHPVAFFNF